MNKKSIEKLIDIYNCAQDLYFDIRDFTRKTDDENLDLKEMYLLDAKSRKKLKKLNHLFNMFSLKRLIEEEKTYNEDN